MKRTLLFLFSFLAGFSGVAATLTVSPAIITNDYKGIITLQIAVPSGSTVRIDKLVDLNTNGVIDSSDMLLESSVITDGQVPTIGGVRNLNVPGDEDGAVNGAIRVEFRYPGIAATLSMLAANYLFRVVGTGESVIGSAPFQVRQKVQAQGIEGQITNANGTAVSGVIILTDDPASGGTITDANGNYRVYTPSGEINVIVVKPGSITRFAEVMVPSNSFLRHNTAAIPGQFTVSGTVVDESTGASIAGAVLILENEEGFVSLAISGTNGAFSVSAFAGVWNAFLAEDILATKGYLASEGEFEVTGNVTGELVEVEKGTSMIYGTVRANGQPVEGADVEAEQIPGHNSLGETKTSADGRYSILVEPGTVRIMAEDSEEQLFPVTTNVTISANQALAVDIDLQVPTAHLKGRVVNDLGEPITGTWISACSYSDGQSACISEDLQADGSFDLGVTEGDWSLSFSSEELQRLNLIAASNPFFEVTNGQTISNITVQIRRTTHEITGTVRDPEGMPVSGIQVFASNYDNNTNWFVFAQTDSAGMYRFKIFPATWQVNLSSFSLQQRGFKPEPQIQVEVTSTDEIQNFDLERVSAFITGRVVDESNSPIPFISVIAVPDIGSSSSSSTDANGNFNIGAGDGLWTLQLSSSEAEERELITPTITVTVSNETSVSNIVLAVRRGTAFISGAVQDDQGFRLPGLPVYASTTLGGTNYFTSSQTTDNGIYSLRSFPSVWTISLDCFSFDGLTSRGYECEDNVVTNTTGNATINFTVSPARPLEITTSNLLPNGSVGVNYNYSFTANGGNPPFFWFHSEGDLPEGINVDSTGFLNGTPTQAGSYTFTIGVTDSEADFASKEFTLQIEGGSQQTSLSMPNKTGSQFTFTVNGASQGQNYTVWWSTNLTSWSMLYSTNAPGSSFTVRDASATDVRRFYKVQ